MRLIKQALWILAFLVVTFFWMVGFQHGFSLQNLSEGAKEEVETLLRQIKG
jgi:hypothetical protein